MKLDRDRHGRYLPTEKRFWLKVDKRGPDECWEWTGSRLSDWEYGRIRDNGKNKATHRLSWELHNGEIPEGLLVCHHCDNPPCVNPKHLFLGGHSENQLDSFRKGRRKPLRGERNGGSKLSTYDVLGIRKLYRQGRFTQKELADKW